MAFISIPSAWRAVGEALKAQLFNRVSDNLDDLDSRVASVEAVANKKVFFNGVLRGASSFTSGTNAAQLRVEASIDITDIKIGIYDDTTAITSGILEVEIIKATGAGDGPDFTTSVNVSTTNPSIDFSTASDYSESTNVVLDNTNKILVEGDYIQLNVVSKPAALGRFFFYCIGEAS